MNKNASPMVSIRLMETCFKSERFPELFSGEGTHDPALRFVGQLVRHTQDETLILDLVKSGLPESYVDMPSTKEKNTLDEAPGMIRDALSAGFHESSKIDYKKGVDKNESSQAEILVELVRGRKDVELFHGPYQRPYITYRDDFKGAITRRLTSTTAAMWLKGLFYNLTGDAISTHHFTGAVETLQAIALFSGQKKDVFLRLAHDGNCVIVNLANDTRQVVIIDSNSVEVTIESPVAFIDSQSKEALPVPLVAPGDPLKELQILWGVSDEIFMILLIFMINCLNPRGPYLCLLVEGEQGSGKSLLCSMLKNLIDPSQAPRLRFPKDERDLMIAAQDNYLLLFDNISGISGDMSDALCSLSTGSGFATRKLYTDDEQQIFNECRAYILNGIADYVTRPDLMERSVCANLPAMREGQRKTEEEINCIFQELRPRVLAKLYDIVSCALRRYGEVQAPTTVRMADAAKWIVAAEPATGYQSGTLLRALEENQHHAMTERMDNNSVANALIEHLKRGPYVGGVNNLFKVLQVDDSVRFDRSFPKTAQHLSKKLKQLRPALKKAGINIDFPPRGKEGQKVILWMEGHGNIERAKQLAAEKERNSKY